MKTEQQARIIASIGTALIAALVVLLLCLCYLTMPAKEDVAKPKGEIVMVDEEEFIEVIETQAYAAANVKETGASYLEDTVVEQSQPTPASGTDVADRGEAADPPTPISSNEPSPVKVKKDEEPRKTGPAEDKEKAERENTKRQAQNEVANALKKAQGKHNSSTSSEDRGNAGDSRVDKSQQGTTGHGTGNVGGGWIIPKYAAVPSNVTGSVKMVVKIDNTGKVISVAFNGGEPPAATNSAVRSALEREVRSKKFSRSSYDDAQPATAYITYTFK